MKHSKHTSEKQLKHYVDGSHGLPGGELRWRRPPIPANNTRWLGALAQAQAQVQA